MRTARSCDPKFTGQLSAVWESIKSPDIANILVGVIVQYKLFVFALYLNILKLRVKTKPITAGADAIAITSIKIHS